VRKTLKLVLAAALGTVVVPTLAYLAFPSDEDPMGETLSELGFVRVPLPSNLMNVGSLYYVDAGLKDFKTACHARPDDLGEDVIRSPSGDIERILERKGGLATDIAVDFGALFGSKFGDKQCAWHPRSRGSCSRRSSCRASWSSARPCPSAGSLRGFSSKHQACCRPSPRHSRRGCCADQWRRAVALSLRPSRQRRRWAVEPRLCPMLRQASVRCRCASGQDRPGAIAARRCDSS
jgi:hypothetical protein